MEDYYLTVNEFPQDYYCDSGIDCGIFLGMDRHMINYKLRKNTPLLFDINLNLFNIETLLKNHINDIYKQYYLKCIVI